jgi:hypothetical protein
MYWLRINDGGFALRAITQWHENGSMRTRLCKVVYDLPGIVAYSEVVAESGGCIDMSIIKEIFKSDEHWKYGWTPDLRPRIDLIEAKTNTQVIR